MREFIDAAVFKDIILCANAALEQNRQLINELNVFPVPDGDTGTNMSLTMGAAAAELSKKSFPTLSAAADCAASAMLRGARGNSGVILSLLFRGLAKRLKGAEKADAKLYAVDTLCASLGQGMLIYLAVQQKRAGKSIEEVRDYVEENKLHLCHWFTVDDLHHLHRGGRVSATSAVLGTMLNIKPVLHVDDEGRLIFVEKVRGRRTSLKALLQHMEATAIAPETQTIFISHGDCLEEAQLLGQMIRDKLHVQDVVINYVGPVIGAHSGPGTLALFFLGTKR